MFGLGLIPDTEKVLSVSDQYGIKCQPSSGSVCMLRLSDVATKFVAGALALLIMLPLTAQAQEGLMPLSSTPPPGVAPIGGPLAGMPADNATEAPQPLGAPVGNVQEGGMSVPG